MRRARFVCAFGPPIGLKRVYSFNDINFEKRSHTVIANLLYMPPEMFNRSIELYGGRYSSRFIIHACDCPQGGGSFETLRQILAQFIQLIVATTKCSGRTSYGMCSVKF